MTTVWFVMDWTLRSSATIVAGAILLSLFRLKSASVRLAVWVALLCASLAIPVLTIALPTLPLPAMRPPQIVVVNPAVTGHAAATPEGSTPRAMTQTTAEPPARRFDWLPIAAFVYASVAGILLLRLGIGLVRGTRLAGASHETGLGS